VTSLGIPTARCLLPENGQEAMGLASRIMEELADMVERAGGELIILLDETQASTP